MNKTLKLVLLLELILNFVVIGASYAAEKILFSYEDGTTQGWMIPEFAIAGDYYSTESVTASKKYALDGKGSLEVTTNLPGAKWMAAYVEVQEFFDWSDYSTIVANIYLPNDAPEGLKVQFTVNKVRGQKWQWIEMSRSVPLVPGKWTVLKANLKPGSTDWIEVSDDATKKPLIVTDEFRQNIGKLGIRIISERKPVYKGVIYIDSIIVEE